MIYCIANKKPEDYVLEYALGSGLWDVCGHDPALFGLACLCTVVPFDYEPGMEEAVQKKMVASIRNSHLLEETLSQKVGGMEVGDMILSLTPPEFLSIVESNGIGHLKAVKMYPEKSVGTFRFVVRHRVLQWRHHYRGLIKNKEGIVVAKFRSDLTKTELMQLDHCISEYKISRGVVL